MYPNDENSWCKCQIDKISINGTQKYKNIINIPVNIVHIINHPIAFLDVFITGINNQNLTLQTYHESTYAGLLLNLKSLTSCSHKVSLTKCLVDRSFKVCKNWNLFHIDKKALNIILLKTRISFL